MTIAEAGGKPISAQANAVRSRSFAQQSRLLSRGSVFCAALVALAVLLIWPIAEVGISDGFVYTMIAQDFARTGHFIFHGWASPMLGLQAIWGALFVKLFGSSFTAVRLSMTPIAASAALFYNAILRRFGLNPAHAVFGTLTLAFSPIFLPLSVSFLTDVPALLAVLVCLYLCQVAIQETRDSRAAAWLAMAAFSNVALGSARQIAWLGALVMIPACMWILRRRRYIIPVGIASWTASVVCISALTRWFNHQPYTAPEKLIAGRLEWRMAPFFCAEMIRGLVTILLLLLPILTLALASVWPLRRRTVLQLASAAASVFILIAVCHHWGKAYIVDSPWLGNTFSRYGTMRDGFFESARSIPAIGRGLLILAVVVCTVASVQAFNRYRKEAAEPPTGLPQPVSWADMSVLLLPFLASYALLLIPRALFFYLWDRYLLEIIAVLFIYALRWHQEHVSFRIPAVSAAALILFSILIVADQHGTFSMYRAEVRLVRELAAAGVPRTQIRGGDFTLDFETQARAWGYVNDPRIINPPTAYHPEPQLVPLMRDGVNCSDALQSYVPVLHVRFAIAAVLAPCWGRTKFAPQTYYTWLPPFRNTLFIGRPLPPNQKAIRH